MIGIKAISTYLPDGRVDNLERAHALGSTPDQIQTRIGFETLAIKDSCETTLGMAQRALTTLLHDQGLAPDAIDVLVVLTQNPDRPIPHLSAELHGTAKLSSRCACFDVSLGCSGYVYGLSIVSAFKQANGYTCGVLVTADPYSGIIAPSDKNTSLIFGDGATATLLTDTPTYTLGQFNFGTQGTEADKLACNDGVLHMNGRAVFNFAAQHVPTDIRSVLAKNRTDISTVDRFVLHQGSRYIVETIADRLQVPREKAPFVATRYGNTVSSSIPFILSELLDKREFTTLVLSGFGLGFSWASTVLKRQPSHQS
ncbi:ketoacyl-ACP synthase III [Achromobacter xylosoxidans]|uniref:ketoacyl-ACP synthase III n=1 Tax=Alcaligenes xylosoxydans xylosoxydans TaxID=85698 RepID=UPI001F144EC2|nr:ketoacyl-ACP synthase III [Achromobacter xylosoxidans]